VVKSVVRSVGETMVDVVVRMSERECAKRKRREILCGSRGTRREREREAAQRTDKGSCSLPVVTLTMVWACGRGAVAVVSIVMEEEEERCRCVGVVCGMPLM
jgi:hypothetical protein